MYHTFALRCEEIVNSTPPSICHMVWMSLQSVKKKSFMHIVRNLPNEVGTEYKYNVVALVSYYFTTILTVKVDLSEVFKICKILT